MKKKRRLQLSEIGEKITEGAVQVAWLAWEMRWVMRIHIIFHNINLSLYKITRHKHWSACGAELMGYPGTPANQPLAASCNGLHKNQTGESNWSSYTRQDRQNLKPTQPSWENLFRSWVGIMELKTEHWTIKPGMGSPGVQLLVLWSGGPCLLLLQTCRLCRQPEGVARVGWWWLWGGTAKDYTASGGS